MLIRNPWFQFIKVYVLFIISGLIADHEYIAGEIVLYSTDSANEISKINVRHLRTSAVIACDKQVICR